MKTDGRGGCNFIDLTGEQFIRWTVLGRAENAPGRKVRWLCRCSCGTEKVVRATSLQRGKSISCGCWQREDAAKRATFSWSLRERKPKIVKERKLVQPVEGWLAEIDSHERRRRKFAMNQNRARALKKGYAPLNPDTVHARPSCGQCEVCQNQRSLVMDHDHETGNFRGWLCHPCNRSLGILGDNINGLERAIAYLRSALSRRARA